MANLKVRLEKLESRLGGRLGGGHRVAYVVVMCGHNGGMLPDTGIIGYQCEGVTVWREAGELADSCLARCKDAVDWGEGHVVTKTFGPIIADNVKQLSLISGCTN
jgi:hypothetical protein